MPNTTGNQEPFVKRFEMAIMQYVILNKAQQGEVTRDNLKQTFRGNLQMTSDHFDHCITELVRDGHLREIGGSKYTVTDDGREDVNKLQTLVLELPNVIQQSGGQQRQGIPQSAGGGATGSTAGNQGNFNSPKPQVSGQERTGDVSKGGANR